MKQNKKRKHLIQQVQQPLPPVNLTTGQLPNPWYKKEWLYFALLFFIVTMVWSRLTNFTWDDDAVGRFLNVQSAEKNPYTFLDSWNRPLFSFLFYLPIRLFGRMGLVIVMSLLTTISGCLLYKALEEKNEKRASVVIILMVFQTFLFGISRDAMTEPLASFLFSLGIYFYFKKNYTWFAVAGSLLPLARTETIVLIPFWMIVLVQAKQYWKILLLGCGMAVWALGLFIYSGHFFEIFSELLKTGDKQNRYAHNPTNHHFIKYVYVTGPVVFYFFTLGFLTSAKRIISQYFIFLQFIAGFMTYVIFSAYLDLGQSGGALRNLITLSPFAAMIAYYGFRFWLNTATATATVSQSNKSGLPVSLNQIILIIFTLFFLLSAWQAFTNKLMSRQYFHEFEKDYTLFNFLLGTAVIILISLTKVFRKEIPVLVHLLLALQIAFTLRFESPSSHENGERKILNTAASMIKNLGLDKEKIYANHSWYFYTTGTDILDTSKKGAIDSTIMKKLQPGNVVVWENHYTNQNYTNIPITYLLGNESLIALKDYVDSSNGFTTLVLLKEFNDIVKTESLLTKLIQLYPNDATSYYYYGSFLLQKKNDFNKAINNFDKALLLNRQFYFAYFLRGYCYLKVNERNKACNDLRIAAAASIPDAKRLLDEACK